MSDMRASIKIEMEFMGIKRETDMWINWSPNDTYGVDDRVLAWFQEIYEDGMKEYRKKLK